MILRLLLLALFLSACGDAEPVAADASSAAADTTTPDTSEGPDTSPSDDVVADVTSEEEVSEFEDAALVEDVVPVEDAAPVDDATLVDDAPPVDDVAAVTVLEVLLDALRANPEAALLAQAGDSGWPAAVEGGFLYVTTGPLHLLAGDHDSWVGAAMTPDEGFHWLVLDTPAGSRYKFTDQTTFTADPWSRAYEWDEFGQMSMRAPTGAHLERLHHVGGAGLSERTVRVWVPAEAPTHVLYVQDGQNLFNPDAIWGGWKLNTVAPSGMLIVGIDNTPARIDEYTHALDNIGSGPVGGLASQYAELIDGTVRPLIAEHYSEPALVGVMGSSLGGLVSLYLGSLPAGGYDFVASLSGTVGWGSIGAGVTNETVIERYAALGKLDVTIYLDSGGSGSGCPDSDMDGIHDDDDNASDNYCTNQQLNQTLMSAGWTAGQDLHYVHEPGAPHNEAAWAARVAVPVTLFSEMSL